MDPERRLLVVNADDFGLTEGVSRAIVEASRSGIVTSTSIIALTPAFEASMRMLGDAPGLGCGVHFAAVGEDPPLLSAAEVPTLVDRKGRLASSWRVLLPRVAAGRVDPDDLRREFEAQFDAIASHGVTIDHVDTHQNVHLWPSIGDVVLDIGERHGVKAVRVTRSTARGVVGTTVRRLARRFESTLRMRGWRCPDASTGLDEAGHLDLGAMVGALDRLSAAAARSAELATHPGPHDDPARARYEWDYAWGAEFDALCSPVVHTAVETLGFELGTFAELGAMR